MMYIFLTLLQCNISIVFYIIYTELLQWPSKDSSHLLKRIQMRMRSRASKCYIFFADQCQSVLKYINRCRIRKCVRFVWTEPKVQFGNRIIIQRFIHTCDLLGMNYSLNNGLYCAKRVHSHLLFGQLLHQHFSRLRGLKSSYNSLRLINRIFKWTLCR